MPSKKEIELKKEKARKISIYEGSSSAVSSGFGDSYIIPFAQELLSKPLQIGFLSAFPNLLSPLAQAYGSRLMEKNSRKNIVLKSVFFHALMWLAIAVLGILAYFKLSSSYIPIYLIVIYSILAIFGGLGGPAWFSWMGDIIDEKHRGKYFGIRNTITGAFSMLAFLAAAFFLDYFKTKGLVMIAFSIVFAAAFLFRFIALFFFKRQYDPPFKIKKEDYYFTFTDFLKKFTNFTKFSLFLAVFNLSASIAGPFFAVYMLKELQFSYAVFMVVSLSGTLFYLLLMPIAGKIADKYGNLNMIHLSIIFYSAYPILWMVFSDPLHLIFINQLVGGIASAAFTIGVTDFIYDTVTPAKRGLCVSYSNILVGIGIFAGSIIGGLILSNVHFPAMNVFFFIFGLSAAMRILSSVAFLPFIKEMKSFEKIPKPLLYIFHPIKIFHLPLVWAKSLPKRFL
jgi:MFS family permease